jgi:SAM-dependent methyltransferase
MEKISPPLGENGTESSVSSVEAADSSGWSASLYNKAASFVYSTDFIAPVLDLLEAKPGERIFDFGCGTGEVTLQIAETVGKDGLVVGVDLSESMVSAKSFLHKCQLSYPTKIEKAKANGVQHAFLSDIQHLLIPESSSWIEGIKFDAVFSNACLHWCKENPAGVLESAKRVLKPGGRFVGEMGGFMSCVGKLNRIAIGKPFVHDCLGVRSTLHVVLRRRGYDPVALDPWYLPSVASYRKARPSYLE